MATRAEIDNMNFGVAAEMGPYGQQQGALRDILRITSGSSANADRAIALANQLMPPPEEADPYEAMFRYFSGMAKAASQPGATVLSSALAPMDVPLDYYTAKKKELKQSEQARMQAALSLGPSLKPKEKTATALNYKSVMITKPDGTSYEDYIPTSQIADLQKQGFKVLAKSASGSTSSGFKAGDYSPGDKIIELRTALDLPNLAVGANGNVFLSADQVEIAQPLGLITPKTAAPKEYAEKYLAQDTVVYMSEADAITKLATFGVTPESTEYADLIELMTTDDEDLYGTPVIRADQFISFYIPRNPNSDLNVTTKSPGSSSPPPQVIARNEELKRLIPIQMKQRQVMNDLLPTLESAMAVLMQNPDTTGAFQAYTMPIRNFMSSAFGYADDELSNQRYLEAISNKLAPQMRPIGSGATSDMEFKAYKSAILSMENPARANYLTLYSLDKTTRNAAAELAMRKRFLSAGKSETYILNKISELDKGIYSKFDGADDKDENGDFIYDTQQEYTTARDAWKNNLPSGAVILNKDSSGNKIYPNAGTFIIKDWRGTN